MSELVIRSRQRLRFLNGPLLRRIARHIVESELDVHDYELGIHVVDATEMTRVNLAFLKHKGSTDVITFDYGSSDQRLHGDLFICMADAVTQARGFKTTWQSEAIRYLIHGLLHLCGFDDLQPDKRRAMRCEENRLLLAVRRRFNLGKIAHKQVTKSKSRTTA